MKLALLRPRWWYAATLFICLRCFPQIPAAVHPPGAPPPAQPTVPADPLHRETPRGTVLNFLKYAHRGDYATASKYLQPKPKSAEDLEELARELLTLMDSYFRGKISLVSDLPEGSQADITHPDTEAIGTIVVQDRQGPVTLTRVPQKNANPIWLISLETLDQVPHLYEVAGAPLIDQYMPDFLTRHQFFGLPLGRWLAILLSMGVALLMGWGVVRLLSLAAKLYRRGRIPTHAPYWGAVRKPGVLVIAILVHQFLVYLIGLPLLYRVYYFRLLEVLLVICITWLFGAAMDANKRRILGHGREKRAAISIVQLLHGIGKAVLIVGAILLVVSLLGFDTKTLVAGLGIGGIALALGAQKTLENLLGGLTLVADSVFAIGDDCVIDGRFVTVEEIGLRSLIVRSREGTQMSFPNGMLAQVGIENVSRRVRFVLSTTLVVSYETSLTQVRCLIGRVREMLYSYSRINQDSARFRLASMTPVGYEVELFAFVQSTAWAEFAAIREDIFFRIADIAEAEGAIWAIPSQRTYLSEKRPVDAEKQAEAEHMVQAWQSETENPFPDFSPQTLARLRGTIAYPPRRTTEDTEKAKPKRQAQQAS